MLKISNFYLKKYKVKKPLNRKEVGLSRLKIFKDNLNYLNNIKFKKNLSFQAYFGDKVKLISDCKTNRKIFIDYFLEKSNIISKKNINEIFFFESPEILINFKKKNINEYFYYLYNSKIDTKKVNEIVNKIKDNFQSKLKTTSLIRLETFEKILAESIINQKNILVIFYNYWNKSYGDLIKIKKNENIIIYLDEIDKSNIKFDKNYNFKFYKEIKKKKKFKNKVKKNKNKNSFNDEDEDEIYND